MVRIVEISWAGVLSLQRTRTRAKALSALLLDWLQEMTVSRLYLVKCILISFRYFPKRWLTGHVAAARLRGRHLDLRTLLFEHLLLLRSDEGRLVLGWRDGTAGLSFLTCRVRSRTLFVIAFLSLF